MIHYILFFMGILFIGVSLFQLKTNFKNASIEHLDGIKEEKIKLMENISDAEAIMEAFNELGERIIQDLDERIHRIESIITLADEKIKNDFLDIPNKDLSSQVDDNMVQENKWVDDNNLKCDVDHLNHDEKKEVLKLFEEGCSPQEIAKQLNKGIGEVQLICSLGKR